MKILLPNFCLQVQVVLAIPCTSGCPFCQSCMCVFLPIGVIIRHHNYKLHPLVLHAHASDQNDPGLRGVLVEEYPIPPIPTRPDDSQLWERLARMPGRDLYEDDRDNINSGKIGPSRPLRVLVAGGGLEGLAVASALLEKGFDVHALEQAVQYKSFGAHSATEQCPGGPCSKFHRPSTRLSVSVGFKQENACLAFKHSMARRMARQV